MPLQQLWHAANLLLPDSGKVTKRWSIVPKRKNSFAIGDEKLNYRVDDWLGDRFLICDKRAAEKLCHLPGHCWLANGDPSAGITSIRYRERVFNNVKRKMLSRGTSENSVHQFVGHCTWRRRRRASSRVTSGIAIKTFLHYFGDISSPFLLTRTKWPTIPIGIFSPRRCAV